MRGVLTVFDVTSKTRRSSIRVAASGLTQLCWPAQSLSLLYVGDVNGNVFSFDGRRGEIARRFRGLESTVLGLAVDRELRLLFACGDDASAQVFEL